MIRNKSGRKQQKKYPSESTSSVSSSSPLTDSRRRKLPTLPESSASKNVHDNVFWSDWRVNFCGKSIGGGANCEIEVRLPSTVYLGSSDAIHLRERELLDRGDRMITRSRKFNLSSTSVSKHETVILQKRAILTSTTPRLIPVKGHGSAGRRAPVRCAYCSSILEAHKGITCIRLLWRSCSPSCLGPLAPISVKIQNLKTFRGAQRCESVWSM